MSWRFYLAALCVVLPAIAAAQDQRPSALPLLEPSTDVESTTGLDSTRGFELAAAAEVVQQRRWDVALLLAKPRVSSGDVQSISSSIREDVSAFVLTLLANVEVDQVAVDGSRKFRLAEVGVGYSVATADGLRIVRVADAAKAGVSLGLVQRQMLSENWKRLSTLRQIARTSTITMFDAPAIMLRDGQHEACVMRHFVWLDSQTGRCSMLVWLLRRDASGELSLIDEPLRCVLAGTREDRLIHVDRSEFLFGGIPTERAFALEGLPPGKTLEWTDASREHAAHGDFSSEQFKSLALALNAVLQASKSQASR